MGQAATGLASCSTCKSELQPWVTFRKERCLVSKWIQRLIHCNASLVKTRSSFMWRWGIFFLLKNQEENEMRWPVVSAKWWQSFDEQNIDSRF